MFKNILVGIDGSEHSIKAAHTAGEMARCMGAHIWVVACFEPVPVYLGEPYLNRTIQQSLDFAEDALTMGLKEIGEVPGEIHTTVLEGSPAETILSVAGDNQIDLIVMGTRGLGRLGGLLLGSQSTKVVSQAECPVLLVR
jgi:nucleotide-binding universal stress UspA family protein